ncbi:MAG: apolipoprotein N-acyltransferase [Acidobacteria bacterium]|nr:apolipoprotein N-acyltransferase [Acidobacteriota bacterium]
MPLLVAVSRANRLRQGYGGPPKLYAKAEAGHHEAGDRTAHGRSIRPFLLGVTTGFVYFSGTLYWLTGVMQTYGGLNLLAALGTQVLLILYLAAFPALFAWMAAVLIAGYGMTGLLLTPAAWVLTELGRTHLFGGFPWVLLGYSQATNLPVAQIASVLGVFGVSALVALVNAALGAVVLSQGRGARTWPAITAAAVLIASTGWGYWRIRDARLVHEGTPIRVALVQGNVAQDDKWNPQLAPRILERYLSMTQQATRQGATLVIWPESATPFLYEDDPVGARALRALVRDAGVHLLFGSDQIERDRPPRSYNAAFMLDPAGRTRGVYRKIHLVPFGEFVPLKRMLFFVKPLVEAISDFSPGTDTTMLSYEDHRISTAICYEVVYPRLIRQMVLSGSELLTTITNDAWYGRSSAPHQHFWQAAMRSIEEGRYLARAANTGVSGIVDPYGRAVIRSELFVPDVLVGEVRLLAGRTPYARFGDLFAYLVSLLCAGAIALDWWLRRASTARGWFQG